MRTMTEDEPVVARVQAMDDGRGLARCGQPRCGAPLVYVLDFETPKWLSARGYAFDGAVWRPTKHHRDQRLRAKRRVTAGRGDASDRARLKAGQFDQGGDPTDSRVAVGWGKRDPVYIDPPDEPGYYRSWEHRLPAQVECPQCGRVNRVAGEAA
jgi:hypothetical protein